ncbi:alpha/beta hydrolase fold-domain-containing protein [Auriculariales sp. MPI-PUGE-AT-0066]|nr:alpha/beta hydrolase fold-domain-containing protein [Auriculariales sp. MPI-PUGE-AT-0066]
MAAIHPSILPLLTEEYLGYHRKNTVDGPPMHKVPFDPAIRFGGDNPNGSKPLQVGSIKVFTFDKWRMRVFTPDSDKPAVGWPAMVFYHGGGWAVGKTADNFGSDEHIATNLCQRAGAIVLNVDYRLAPEDPFPAAIDDAWSALNWTYEEGADILGIDRSKISVGGPSAGGNLAAAVTHMAAQATPPIPLLFQLLIVPVLDNTSTLEESPYVSWSELKHMPGLDPEQMIWFREMYMPREEDWKDWKASPMLAPPESFAKAPPAWIGVAGLDILRDEGISYGEKLRAAGVKAEVVICCISAFLELTIFAFAGGSQLITDACIAFRNAVQAGP